MSQISASCRSIIYCLLIIFIIFSGIASAEYRANNTYLDISVGETSSNRWNFMYAPGVWGNACYREHFGVYTRNWNATRASDSYDFTVDQRFEESKNGRTAKLHSENLSVIREVYLPPGDAKYFNISYTLKNNGSTQTLRDVRFFEVVDYDIVTSADDYGWYANTTDTVWESRDLYFRNGFGGDKRSTGHGMEYYSFETNTDWADGVLNGLNKYPESGVADLAVGMQWNLSDLEPGRSWEINITFYFGGASGIYVDAGPHQTVGVGRPVRLDASRSTSIGVIKSYEWDLNGDGIYDVNVTSPVYQFAGWNEPGEHTITLRVTDRDGRNSTATTTITVVSGALEGVNDTFRISLLPERAITSTSPGGKATFTIDLSNDQSVPDTFDLNLSGADPTWYSLPGSVNLSAGEESQIALMVTVPQNAPDGNVTLLLHASSRNIGGSKEIRASLNVTSAPMILDLLPEESSRIGSRELLVSWMTPVNASSDVFIRSEGEEGAEFRRISGEPGESHAVNISGLSRNSLYEYYVRSETGRGRSQSEIRRIFIDNGISFEKKAYNFSIERDYNQSVFVDVRNTDTKPHELLMQVSGVPDDLALNFVGEGSADQRIALLPDESKSIELVFHAQDALKEEYRILLNLTNLGTEPVTDSAIVNLKVHFPVIDYSIEEVKSDPYTLAKTIRITNKGDPLTDLSIIADPGLSDLLIFQPAVDHSYLGTGQTLEFVAEPVLAEGFTRAAGTLAAKAGRASRNLSVEYAVPPGKAIFVGHQPNMSIRYDPELDGDSIPSTNPNGGSVASYTFKGANGTYPAFIAQVRVIVEQDGKPAGGANAILNLSSNGDTTTIASPTDLWGRTEFILSGPPGSYSYTTSVEGFDLATPPRSFTVDQTPTKAIEPGSITWKSAQDANGTYDLGDPAKKINLSSPPFTIRASKEGLESGVTPVLYLNHEANYSSMEVIGKVEGSEIVFNFGYADPGNYTATLATQSDAKIATSSSRKIFFSEGGADMTYQGNYTYEWPYPVDSSTMSKVSATVGTAKTDPHKVIRLLYLTPDENRTSYFFIYMILSDRNLSDTLRVTARDGRSRTIYQNAIPINLTRGLPIYVALPIPVRYEDGTAVEGFNLSVATDDPTETACNGEIWKDENGVWQSHGTLWYLWHNGVLTPHNRPGVVIKCLAGFVPGVNWGINVVDLVNNIDRGNYGTAGRNLYGLTVPPVREGLRSENFVNGVRGWNPARWVGGIKNNLAPPEFIMIDPATNRVISGPIKLIPIRDQIKTLGQNVFVDPLRAGKLSAGLTILGWGSNLYSNYDNWRNVIREIENEQKPAGLQQTQSVSVSNCINHAPLKSKVLTDLDFLCSPVRNVDGVFVRLFFAREPPASYQPFNTVVRLNGHKIGSINNTVPRGTYVFSADPIYLNYADRGPAENTIKLDVDGMNRGYYVPLQGYKIDMLFKKLKRAVCASSQEEADSAVGRLSGAMVRQADLALTVHDIALSNLKPRLGENVTIEARVHNLGSIDVSGVEVRLLVDDLEIDSREIAYMAMYSSETVSFSWQAEGGNHVFKVQVNPRHIINESDYSNNEATKAITVAGLDTGLPVISNIQPPAQSNISYNLPLISADLSDDGSGIDPGAVRISVDGKDMTANATVIPSRVWFTPAVPLSSGSHQVNVKAVDRQGNAAEKSWSFSVSSDSTPPQITNPQPPDGASVGEPRPLITAGLKDDDSGVDTSSVKILFDGADVTSRARILPTKVWYTPERSLAAGEHRVTIRAGDNQGNKGSLDWSFTIKTGPGQVVGPATNNTTVCIEGCMYGSIQGAIDAASPMSRVEVGPGTYHENVLIDKPLTLKGIGLPLIDAGGNGSALTLNADGITIEGLWIANSTDSGIAVMSSGDMIRENRFTGNLGYGIHLISSNNSTMIDNIFEENGFGIYIGDLSFDNKIVNNSAIRNDYGAFIDLRSSGNLLYLNSFIDNNAHDAYDFDTDIVSANRWDNGSIGNYYSDMDCTDSDGDGICDSPYSIPGGLGIDRYPRASENVIHPGRNVTPPGPGEEPMRVISHGMSKDTGGSMETTDFSTSDIQAVSWIEIGPVYGPHQLEWDWYDPDGIPYDTTNLQTLDPKISGKEYVQSMRLYSSMDILGSDAELYPGIWQVDVFIDGELAYTEEFSIDTIGDLYGTTADSQEVSVLHPVGNISIPGIMQECEVYGSQICGEWTLENGRIRASWNNGASAILNIEQFDGSSIVLTREDLQGSSAGLKARYTGQVSGNHIEGSVTWTREGSTWTGTWEANWQQ